MVVSTNGLASSYVDNGTEKSNQSLFIGSLFTNDNVTVSGEFDNEQNFSYKLFSFNFKIPKVGWDRLNDIMYAKNPYLQTDILHNGETSLIDTVTTPLDQLKSLNNSNVIFSGNLSFIYLVLDNRVVEQVVGSGNYRRWWIYRC